MNVIISTLEGRQDKAELHLHIPSRVIGPGEVSACLMRHRCFLERVIRQNREKHWWLSDHRVSGAE